MTPHEPRPLQPAHSTFRRTLLSICVPTFNRADFLNEFLAHVASFRRLNYEVVISDNASRDHTPTVIAKWERRLKRLHYVRQRETVTPPENVCAVCNIARGDYIFRIADDDQPIEEGLLAAQRILDTALDVAAVYGTWRIFDSALQKAGYHASYGQHPIRIQRSALLKMFTNFWTTELPIFRRETYQRHFLGYSVQLPLDFYAAAQFANYGDLMFIPDAIAKIRSHDGQDSRDLFAHRLQQEYLSDQELFLNIVPETDTNTSVGALIQKRIQMNVQAVQTAIKRKRYLDAQCMIKRLLAWPLSEIRAIAFNFEKRILVETCANYLAEICRLDAGINRVLLQESSFCYILKTEYDMRGDALPPIILCTEEEILCMARSETDLIITTDKITLFKLSNGSMAGTAKIYPLDYLIRACLFFSKDKLTALRSFSGHSMRTDIGMAHE